MNASRQIRIFVALSNLENGVYFQEPTEISNAEGINWLEWQSFLHENHNDLCERLDLVPVSKHFVVDVIKIDDERCGLIEFLMSREDFIASANKKNTAEESPGSRHERKVCEVIERVAEHFPHHTYPMAKAEHPLKNEYCFYGSRISISDVVEHALNQAEKFDNDNPVDNSIRARDMSDDDETPLVSSKATFKKGTSIFPVIKYVLDNR